MLARHVNQCYFVSAWGIDMQHNQSHLLGIGLYTFSEAARLTKVPSRRIRRWVRGYRFRLESGVHEMPPVLDATLPTVDSAIGLEFLDLIEIRLIQEFRNQGVGWRVIRSAAERAREILQTSHPFAAQRFKTDGRAIFLETVEAAGETKLLDLFRSQYAFHRVVEPSLKGLEFSEGKPILWYPMYPKKQVVVDPARSFGQPIVASAGVPTEVLARTAEVEGSVEAAARWFDVPRKAVTAAIEFEQRLAA